MPIPQTPRFGELLRRAFITKEYPSPIVLDDYFPSIDLFTDKPEMLRLRGECAFAAGGQALGGVGTTGVVWLMNKSPNHLAMVTAIIVSVRGASQSIAVDFANNPAGFPVDGLGGGVAVAEDTRYGVDLSV